MRELSKQELQDYLKSILSRSYQLSIALKDGYQFLEDSDEILLLATQLLRFRKVKAAFKQLASLDDAEKAELEQYILSDLPDEASKVYQKIVSIILESSSLFGAIKKSIKSL